ncbi:BMP family ABC transporter substrate-binding protein [Cellulomonas sp. H30R-01]|uniref:BMP family ABC transporter substrate-binding protein n=1 Tax=Cellulomonas algicola TaxID=2071633 RepID=A0A401V2T3_9CELL|nr:MULTISPECIES: BMP family ABC transporter substrate-binding protein [Cellulomonas]QHT54899.1 BMP family ABC transporter substrate-binding protein [Cellulomonas sp. H30R-01]GCD21218.1 BMP family ABC transporter substrate-binding protein [Cellulomonas algicola]
MKKIIRVAALGGAVALALAACGSAPEDTNETAGGGDTAAATDFKGCMVSDFGGFDDNSFNQSGIEGLERAVDELGIEQATAESTDAGQYKTNVDSMIQASCDLIITVGFNLADTTAEAADANPDQHFALIDSGVDPARDNVKPLLFNTQEAAYLAGYVAAAMSKTGAVGTFGGEPYPSVTIFMDGFYDGVQKYNEDNGTAVKVLGWDKTAQNGTFTNTFEITAKGEEATNALIAQGADVILPVAGPVGEGALTAARAAGGVLVIGVDSDFWEQPKYAQYKDIILTSVLKQIGQSVFDTISATAEGEFDAEPYVGTLANEGVGLAPFHDLESSVPADVVTKIDELKQQIVDGDLTVESPSQN